MRGFRGLVIWILCTLNHNTLVVNIADKRTRDASRSEKWRIFYKILKKEKFILFINFLTVKLQQTYEIFSSCSVYDTSFSNQEETIKYHHFFSCEWTTITQEIFEEQKTKLVFQFLYSPNLVFAAIFVSNPKKDLRSLLISDH